MPELDAKMRTAASMSRRATNGTSHHFFSRAQNRRNSRKTVHMGVEMLIAGPDAVNWQRSAVQMTGAHHAFMPAENQVAFD